jgi:citrate (Re)-synthase
MSTIESRQTGKQPLKTAELQNVDEPNLYRDMFPYTDLPKVAFDDETVPMTPCKEVFVTDTTFRDGQQARPPYTVDQIVDIYQLMTRLDNGSGILRASEFFLYTKKDREAVEKCLDVGAEFPQVTSWIRAVKNDFKFVKDMHLPETGILTSCSDYHIFLKLHKDRKQALSQYLDVAKAALDEGIVPRCHFEDITRADFDGFVIPFAVELMRLREQYGMDVKIRLCDTMGYGVPWVQAKLPRSVPRIVRAMTHQAGVPSELLEWHGHNDFHKVLINPATAWLYGCAGCNASLLGIGERTGNSPLEAMVIEAGQLRDAVAGGNSDGKRPDYTVITEIADYFTQTIGFDIPTNYPLIGRDFNTTRAGIHADGLLKSEEIYSAFDTQKLLRRPIAVAITDKSGAAGLKHWVERHYDQDVAKNDPRLLAMKEQVDVEYERGRTTAISDEELHRWYAESFDVSKWSRPQDD